MTDFARLEPGKKYRIVNIVKDDYLVLECFEAADAGGVHWEEFASE